MLKKQESKPALFEDLTDAEVYASIRYLDPESECIDEPDPIAFVLGLTLIIQLLGCMGTIWFYQWTH